MFKNKNRKHVTLVFNYVIMTRSGACLLRLKTKNRKQTVYKKNEI